jgi:hypothetical protein
MHRNKLATILSKMILRQFELPWRINAYAYYTLYNAVDLHSDTSLSAKQH